MNLSAVSLPLSVTVKCNCAPCDSKWSLSKYTASASWNEKLFHLPKATTFFEGNVCFYLFQWGFERYRFYGMQQITPGTVLAIFSSLPLLPSAWFTTWKNSLLLSMHDLKPDYNHKLALKTCPKLWRLSAVLQRNRAGQDTDIQHTILSCARVWD